MTRYFLISIKSILILSVGFLASSVEGQTTDSGTKQEKTPATAKPDDKEKTLDPITVSVADDNLRFSATGTWKSVPPRSRMLEAELKIPRTGTDEEDGRLTIMGAGGSIEANIDRWRMQFTQPDGSDTKEKTKVEKKTVSGQTVNMVDITGTFMDAVGGPFSGQPKVERKNYRMLAAIIQTEKDGNYFVKLYGPKATIDKNVDHFKKMIKSLKVAN